MLLDAYIRVSQVAGRGGERFISPKVQREQIEAWAAAHGSAIGEIFEELDESGGRADRPLLLRALERVDSRLSEGVIVAKLDRFGRSVIDGLAAIARIEKAGGTFVSVQDGLDLSTPTGKLVLRIMFSMGEWELDRIRSNWESARSQAIARGVYTSGYPPFGYSRGADGRLRPDPQAAPVVAEAFELRAAGATLKEVAEHLNRAGIPKQLSQRPWDGSEAWRLLSRRAYVGEARCGRFVNSHAHDAIVAPELWQLAQLKQRKTQPIEGLLVGLIRCRACGGLMPATLPKGRRSYRSIYRCIGSPLGRCPRPASARADEIEPLVEEQVLRLARSRRRRPAKALEERRRAVLEAEASLTSYRDNPRLQRTLGMSGFEAGVAARQRDLEGALLSLAREKRAIREPAVELADLERRWSGLDFEGRRAVIGELVDCVAVERGEESVRERAWLCRRGRGPLATNTRAEDRPIDVAGLRARRLQAPRIWPEGEIEARLREFTAGRSDWPRYEEFARAGRGRLHLQAMAWGGPHYWAARLDLELDPRFLPWTEERIRGALRPVLSGRESWPSEAEFERAGLLPALWGLRTHGGVEFWAAEFGISYRAPQRRRWSLAVVRSELERFLTGRYSYPSRREFEAAGESALYEAMRRYGGYPHWAREFDLERRKPGSRTVAHHPV